MAMNTNLLNALKEIVSRYGGVETLFDTRRVKALLADLAAAEPKPQKNALTACLEQGFAALLQQVPAHERGAAKSSLAERLNREEGLDMALCADTLDMLEAALLEEGPQEQMKIICRNCGKELQADWKICPYCGTAGEAVAEKAEAAVVTATEEAAAEQPKKKPTNKLKMNGKIILVGTVLVFLFLFINWLLILPGISWIGMFVFNGWTLAHSIIAIFSLLFGPVVGGIVGLLGGIVYHIMIDLFMQTGFYYVFTIIEVISFGLYGFTIGKICDKKTKAFDDKNMTYKLGFFCVTTMLSYIIIGFVISTVNYILIHHFPIQAISQIILPSIVQGLIVAVISSLSVFVYFKRFKGNVPFFQKKQG